MSGWKKFAANFAAQKGRLAIWGIGFLGNSLFVNAFDFILYPYIIWKFGLIWGSIIMFPTSFGVCWLTLIFYDWMKTDWIAIETIKELKEYEGQSKTVRLISRIIQMSDPAAVIILSIWKDPFIVTAYMRKGAHQYNGLSQRDWKIFITSTLVGNTYWALVSFGGIQVVLNHQKIWAFIIKLIEIPGFIA
jgi:hypothetical protein